MKIEILRIEKSTLAEFAAKHDLTLVVEEKLRAHAGCGNSIIYRVFFKDVTLYDGCVPYEEDMTIRCAIKAFMNTISCLKLLKKTKLMNIQIAVPFLTEIGKLDTDLPVAGE